MILGIYHPAQGVGHDTGLALIREDGSVIAALSEERLSRVKMDGGFPFRAYEAIQRIHPFTAKDLSGVAVPFMSTADKTREASHLALATLRDPSLGFKQARNRLAKDSFQKGMAAIGAYSYLEKYSAAVKKVRDADGRPKLNDWRDFLKWCGIDEAPLVHVDHHIAHAAGAYYTSGWEDALLITCDGVGALKSAIVAEGRAGKIKIRARTFYPNSPGEFWEVITAICGFHHFKHGGKITGLAAYGDPNHFECYDILKRALDLDGLSVISRLDPPALAKQLKKFSREDIAATSQRRLEEVVVELAARAVKKTGLRRLALSGGVFANVKLNQRIAELDGVEEVYIYPAMGDEGLGLGAALFAAGLKHGLKPFRFRDLYFGPGFSDAEAEAELKKSKLPYSRHSDAELAEIVAGLLTQNKVIAICRGRMEFGPRALGHRTIVYQTTDPHVNDWLNKRLERTEFMPFAPVTLPQYADACYKGMESRRYAARFMTATCDCTDLMKKQSPAVVHLDGTARPQLIERDAEPFYYDVLEKYHRKSGIPSLVNTSFNMHEEPIVCTPYDAIRAFTLGHLDALVLGPFLVGTDIKK